MDFSNLIQSIKGKFSGKKKYEIFLDYIENIHFPFYKGLERNSTIEFKFPVTVLVGENGCGKSSVLQALENAAAGKSLSQRWFSTSVDPIPDGERPCFWYSYYSKEADKVVQILNTRIKKKIKNSENPDYWEPSRPVVKYGMDPFMEEMKNAKGASGTRWNGTKRKIEYIDFREEISAFDKYFYFEDDPWNKTKQEYIRQYSKYLKLAIDGRYSKSRNLYRKPRLRSVVELTETEVSVLSEILDKQYSSVKIIEHQFYKKWGTSVYFTQKNRDEFFSGCYSEAFAGSGESAVAKLVHKIYEADNGTLLLLDEPEVSLHPGAQKRLLKFILENIRDKGLQVVISTHSPAIVEELPSEAIVVMNQNEAKKFSPIQNVSADIAFQYIGHTNVNKKRIIVEDETAAYLVRHYLNSLDKEIKNCVDVICHAGGAKDIFKEAVVFARLGMNKNFFLLDGDQKSDRVDGSIKVSFKDGSCVDGCLHCLSSCKIQFELNDEIDQDPQSVIFCGVTKKIRIIKREQKKYEACFLENSEDVRKLVDVKVKHPKGNAVADDLLAERIKCITGIDTKQLGFCADSGKENENRTKEMKEYLNYINQFFFFLPMNTPEELLCKCSTKSPEISVDQKEKDPFKNAILRWITTTKKIPKEDISSRDIETYEKELCNSLEEQNPNVLSISSIIRTILKIG